MRLPLRSRLKTARNTQPWLWKSANCVCLVRVLRSVRFSRNVGSDQLPRAAASSGLAVVGVDHVTGGAAAGAEVAGLVVGAEEVKRRVEEARLDQADEHRVGAVLGAEAADAEARQERPARIDVDVRDADLVDILAAGL